METILLKRKSGSCSTLTVEIPEALQDHEREILIVLQPVATVSKDLLPTSSGWPEGFFETTYGRFADEPLERLSQGEFEEREVLR